MKKKSASQSAFFKLRVLLRILLCFAAVSIVTPTATVTATGTPSATPTCTPGGSPGPWTIVAPYPEILQSAAVSSDGTFAYSAGGANNFVPTTGVYRYDPIANTWTTLAPLPSALFDAGSTYAANVNNVYVFGGLDVNGVVLNTTYVYDIGTNSWTTGAPMPDSRFFPSAAYYAGNGKIYVAGGFDVNFVEQGQTWEYDPVVNTWNTSRAPIPVPMGGAGYSIVGQFMYLAGHWNSGAASTDHYRYDVLADSWSSMAPVPVPIYRPAAAGVGTQELLVGGGNPDLSSRVTGEARKVASMGGPAISYTSTYIYDTISNSWTTGPNTNVPHSFTGGAAIGNLMMVVGGFDGVNGNTNVVESSLLAGPCGSPSPTPTPTPTATFTPTPTATATFTPTATATPRPTPTPRFAPTPRPRPTPPPRP